MRQKLVEDNVSEEHIIDEWDKVTVCPVKGVCQALPVAPCSPFTEMTGTKFPLSAPSFVAVGLTVG